MHVRKASRRPSDAVRIITRMPPKWDVFIADPASRGADPYADSPQMHFQVEADSQESAEACRLADLGRRVR